MGQVTVTVNGRTYRLECGNGEEAHLLALAEYVGSHVDSMRDRFGQVGDDRLILMAALMITDEVWELRRQLSSVKAENARMREGVSTGDRRSHSGARADIAATIAQAARRLELLRAQIAEPVKPPVRPAAREKK